MLWSLLKIVAFICVIAALALGAGYLAETQGGIRISFAGTEFTLGPMQSVIALLVLILSLWLVLKLLSLGVATLRFLSGDETAISRYFNRSRERRGFEALAEGLMALASGEGRTAIAKAARAERYLKRPELTNLITAQAAEMAGDARKAEEVYRRLLKDDRTRFVGVRGIMKQKLAGGDVDTAMKLAEKALVLKPRHVETQDTLLTLQAKNQDWAGARKTLALKLKQGSMPRDLHRRRDAVLALSEAKDIFDDTLSIEAREAAIEANRLSPDLIPAAVMAGRAYATQGKSRYATRVLKKAWEAHPHPDLAAAFAAIEPEESPADRIKRFGALIRSDVDHPEAKMLMAELHIAAEDFPAARQALGDLIDRDPTARSLTIMAAIERGEGADDAVVKGWLARALTAPRGPQWVCNNCHSIHSQWEPVCQNCASFDTLAWSVPPESSAAMPAGAEMLPLIVGSQTEPERAQDIEDAEPAGNEAVPDVDEANPPDETILEVEAEPDLSVPRPDDESATSRLN